MVSQEEYSFTGRRGIIDNGAEAARKHHAARWQISNFVFFSFSFAVVSQFANPCLKCPFYRALYLSAKRGGKKKRSAREDKESHFTFTCEHSITEKKNTRPRRVFVCQYQPRVFSRNA